MNPVRTVDTCSITFVGSGGAGKTTIRGQLGGECELVGVRTVGEALDALLELMYANSNCDSLSPGAQ
jgi:GTPase SAR1 family protein